MRLKQIAAEPVGAEQEASARAVDRAEQVGPSGIRPQKLVGLALAEEAEIGSAGSGRPRRPRRSATLSIAPCSR